MADRRFFSLGVMTNGERISVYFPDKVRARLATTCFRGPKVRAAGNFFVWSSFEELHEDCRLQLLDFAREAISGASSLTVGLRRAITESQDFLCPQPVGWASTDPIEKYRGDELESFNPNRYSTALRVRKELADVRPAPLTRFVTVIAQFRRDKFRSTAWCMVVYSIYPGRDIGELDRDITKRERVVFFDFQHPGAA